MDALVLLLTFAFLLIPFILAKLWWWVVFWCVIAVALALFELVAFLVTKKTISQQFWAWVRKTETPFWKKALVFAGMSAFWIYLLCHLFL